MCGLCSILGDGSHWTDGVRDAALASAMPWLRRQARRGRLMLGRAVPGRSGLTLDD